MGDSDFEGFEEPVSLNKPIQQGRALPPSALPMPGRLWVASPQLSSLTNPDSTWAAKRTTPQNVDDAPHPLTFPLEISPQVTYNVRLVFLAIICIALPVIVVFGNFEVSLAVTAVSIVLAVIWFVLVSIGAINIENLLFPDVVRAQSLIRKIIQKNVSGADDFNSTSGADAETNHQSLAMGQTHVTPPDGIKRAFSNRLWQFGTLRVPIRKRFIERKQDNKESTSTMFTDRTIDYYRDVYRGAQSDEISNVGREPLDLNHGLNYFTVFMGPRNVSLLILLTVFACLLGVMLYATEKYDPDMFSPCTDLPLDLPDRFDIMCNNNLTTYTAMDNAFLKCMRF